MKKTVLKCMTLVFTMFSAIFAFLPWFNINVLSEELHSFITIPRLLADATGILAGYAGKNYAVVIIILGGVLEYLCILSAGLSLVGIWKNCFREVKSRLIFSAQIIMISLDVLALVAIFGVNYLVQTVISMDTVMMPTICFAVSVVFTIASLVSNIMYNRELK